jgi:hypothetical protein
MRWAGQVERVGDQNYVYEFGRENLKGGTISETWSQKEGKPYST